MTKYGGGVISQDGCKHKRVTILKKEILSTTTWCRKHSRLQVQLLRCSTANPVVFMSDVHSMLKDFEIWRRLFGHQDLIEPKQFQRGMVGRKGQKMHEEAMKVTVVCGIDGNVWHLKATQNGFNWYSGNSHCNQSCCLFSADFAAFWMCSWWFPPCWVAS